MRLKALFYLFLLGLFMSCEQPYVGTSTESDGEEDANPNVFLTLKPLPCERVSLAFFQGETKVKTVNVTGGYSSYAQLAITLPLGTYHLVTVAHNSTANATFSSLEKITFKNNLVSETYLSLEELVVDSTVRCTLSLDKVTAKIQFFLIDSLPDEASMLKFYYTGGSSTLSAQTGFGSVNSRQTVKLSPVTPALYTLYTFPHAERDSLRLTVSVLAADESVLREFQIEDIPIQRGCVTRAGYGWGGQEFKETPCEETTNEWGTGYDYPF